MTRVDSNLISQIQESLGRSLQTSNYDLIDVVPIPASSDRMVRLRTLEDALQDFDGYLIQIRPRRRPESISNDAVLARAGSAGYGEEAIYKNDGKLNVQFLMRNA